ncbi:MAG: L-ribulose-5-phosphate 4-epimerase [Clostridia bacterium]
MLYTLKREVLEANKNLERFGLVNYTWGNVSGIKREEGIVIIKPSGVPYADLTIESLVVLDMDGNVLEGKLKPSSDTKTHLMLYKHFKDLGGICHTHSSWATSFAQAKRNIPNLGTTHSDHFRGDIPCTREMTYDEINGEYEGETGKVIIETFKNINENEVPGVLVASHGPFTWGKDAQDAVENARVLENVSEIAYRTLLLNKNAESINPVLIDRHYLRKHGATKSYGQK